MSQLVLFILTVFALALGLTEIRDKRSSIPAVIAYLLLFTLFITFRGTYFPDTKGYIDFYKNVQTTTFYLSSADLPRNLDYGYGVLNQVIKFVFGHQYYFLFFILTSLNLFLIWISSKTLLSVQKNTNIRILYGVLFSLYISYYGFLYNGAVLRGGIALSLLFYSYALLIKRKWIWSILVFLLSIQFHSSAILGLIIAIILFLKIKFKKRIYFSIWLLLGIFYAAKIGSYLVTLFPRVFLFLTKYETLYVFSKWGDNTFLDVITIKYSFKILFFYIIGGIFLTGHQSSYFYKLLNVYFVGLFILVLFPFSYVARVADFFTIIVFLLQYLFLVNLKSNGKKIIYYSCIVVLNTLFVSRILYQGFEY